MGSMKWNKSSVLFYIENFSMGEKAVAVSEVNFSDLPGCITEGDSASS
jgi:hypothetical protein